MGKKEEVLFNEILVSTALLGGVWSAIELNPEAVLIGALGEVLAVIAGPEAAAGYVGIGQVLLGFGLILALLKAFDIGEWFGLAAFASMWIAGYLLVSGSQAGAIFFLLGWCLGAVAIIVHTDESFGSSPSRGRHGRL